MSAPLTATQKAKRDLKRRTVYFIVRRLMDPETGELVRALVASHPVDARSLKERGFKTGGEYMARDLVQARNPRFFRLAHGLGGFLADHVEGFEGLTQHSALKRLQELSGIGCHAEQFSIELGELGTYTGTRNVAESLNFDDMDEGHFAGLWDGGTAAHHEGGWLGWLRREKWGCLSPELIAEVEAMLERPE